MKDPQGVIFDLDGTLIDSLGMWVEVDYLYLKSKGKTPKPGLSAVLKTMSMQQTIFYFKNEYEIDDSLEQITEDIYNLAKIAYGNHIPLKEGAMELLDFLKDKNIKMSVATANHRPLAEAAMGRLGISRYISHFLTCDDLGYGKDDPFIFHHMANLMDSPVDKTIVVEDSLHAVQTAKRAGFYVVGVYDSTAHWEQEEIAQTADLYLTSLKDWPGLKA